MYTYFPLLLYSYTFIAIFICMLCVLFFTYNHFFFSLLSYKFNRHLWHGACWCTHNPAHLPRPLPICIFLSLIPAYVHLNMYKHNPAHRSILLYYYTYMHLPPSSRTLMLASKHTYICQYILLSLLYEPVLPLCFFLRVCVCMYMCTYVCTCVLMNCLYFVCVCFVCVFFLSYRAVYLCLAHCVLCVILHIFITSCVFQNDIKINWKKTRFACAPMSRCL